MNKNPDLGDYDTTPYVQYPRETPITFDILDALAQDLSDATGVPKEEIKLRLIELITK